MSKHMNPKQKEGHELPSARPSGGSLQRAAAPTKVPASHPTAAGPTFPHEQIAARAYQLWEAHGRPAGTDREDWFDAERWLRAEVRARRLFLHLQT